MSYRVLTSPAIPFVHALPSGLGVEPAPSAGSSWKDVILRLSEPFAQAGAQRIAYGKTDPYYSPYGSSQMFYGQGAYVGGGPLASIPSPTTMLLLGGAALVAMMMLRK